jgi:hypothetical protein
LPLEFLKTRTYRVFYCQKFSMMVFITLIKRLYQLPMKLSRPAWNNVIIISAVVMILLLNLMNYRLFPDNNDRILNTDGEQFIVLPHDVILTLEVRDKFIIERTGLSWRITKSQGLAEINKQAIGQMMLVWQQSTGLLQAEGIDVSGQKGIEVLINLAGKAETQELILYPLVDQLLIHDKTLNLWVAMPPERYKQLIPMEVNN